MNKHDAIDQAIIPARRYTWLALVVWSLIISGSLTWGYYHEQQVSVELALNTARANYSKDQAYRFWATRHGGVYVPPDDRTPPNPYLAHIPDRDIVTTDGRRLTLMNPAYMLRQMMTEYTDLYGIKGRITSLKVLNPFNAPDAWETKALESFRKIDDEAVELVTENGESQLRFMKPMMTKTGCLKCHAHQGYKVGDVRGGVSVSIPMARYQALAASGFQTMALTHAGIWLIGLTGIGMLSSHGRQRIVERAKADTKVRELNQELEQRVRELNEQSRRLQEMDRLKDDFLANTSHELRTPLNGIVGLAESLLDGAAGELNAAQSDNLAMVAAAGNRLASMVNDILDFSRLRHHDMELRLVDLDLHTAVDVVITLSRSLTGHKHLALLNTVPEGLAVRADEDRLQQILHNLVGNAVKFTESGTVTVSAERDGERVRVRVTDTGIGIDPDDRERIFDSFEQADGSVSRRFGGTGLGLAISRQLVELHGGHIDVDSRPGDGSCFTFDLAFSESAGRKAGSPQLAAVFAANVTTLDGQAATTNDADHVMVVDDDPVNRQVIINHLALRHYRISEADSGAEALESIAREGPPDAILLDVMMPRLSGFEVCRRLRHRYSPHELPIILVTARNRVNDLVEGLDAGANDYLPKPFSRDELLARLGIHLAMKQGLREKKALGRALNATEQRYRLLFEEASDMIHVVDGKDRISDANRKEIETLGYCREDYIGMSLEQIISPALWKSTAALMEKVRKGETISQYETEFITRDGEPIPVEVSVAPQLRDGHLVAIQTISRDIRDRRNEEAALDQYRSNLEQQVDARTNELSERVKEVETLNLGMVNLLEDLQAANDNAERVAVELRAANEEMTAFNYSVSHDLRSPLRSIDGFSQALLEDYGNQLDDEGRVYLNRVRAAAQRMGTLIDDLLELSRVNRRELKHEAIDLSMVSAEILELLRGGEPGRKVESVIQPDLLASGDTTLLRQLMQNLLDNAWKYTAPREQAKIEFGMHEIEGTPRYFVRDNGVGFDMQYAEKIFLPFQRLHTPEEFSGTGIGLATVQRIVSRHGGDIQVQSEPDGGTTFYFSLGNV